MCQVPKMLRFNLTNVITAISVTLISSGSAVAQVSASDAAIVREHVNKGNLCMSRGLWDQAIEEYEQALDTDPGSMVAKENLVLVHNNWGISLFQRHKYEEAKAQWEEALKMNPYDRNAKQNLSVLKATLARINTAPKPPPKPAAELKDGPIGKSPAGSPGNATNAATGEGKDEAASSGPKMLNASGSSSKPEESSGPKVLGKAKGTETSAEPSQASGGVVIMNSGSQAQTSGGVVLMNSGNQAQTVPDVPAPPAVPPTAPEPPQVSAPPAIDLSSPYSFVETPTKSNAENSSPYGLPTNMSTTVARPPRPYIAPNTTPARPANAWSVPASVSGSADATSPASAASASSSTSASSTPSGEGDAANLEDQLGAIEMKLTGKKQKNMPILKRIEKLEISISGKTNSGSLQERIESLRKSCGL
jgi:Tetratricopeptide repeat